MSSPDDTKPAATCLRCDREEWARGLCNTHYNNSRRRMQAYGKWVGLLPADGTRRRLQALSTLGWSLTDMGERCGFGNARSTLPAIMSGRRRYVHAETARTVATLYDQLWNTPGPWLQVRKSAAAKGWSPPLAWDDDEIDDPNAKPIPLDADPEPVGRVPANFLDIVDDHRSLGRDDHDIAGRLGITYDTFTQRLLRRGAGVGGADQAVAS